MVQAIATGRSPAHLSAEMGASRSMAWRWWRRWQKKAGRTGSPVQRGLLAFG